MCALIDEMTVSMHGGISPDLQCLEQGKGIQRRTEVLVEGLLCDFLWSDPESSVDEWEENDRRVSGIFGGKVFE